MSLPPPNIARQDDADEAAWADRERAFRGDPLHQVAAASLLRLWSAVPAAGALIIIGSWSTGEVVSDRFWWSQFLEWIPTFLVLIAAGLLIVAADVGRRLMRRARAHDPALGRLRIGVAVAALAWACVLGYFVVFELRVGRWLLRSSNAGEHLRVVFWNSGGEDNQGWAQSIQDLTPDLCVFTSLSHEGLVAPIAQAMSKDPVNWPAWVVTHDRFTFISRWRMIRCGFIELNISRGSGLDPREQGPKRYYDPGRAMFLEVEHPAGGEKPLVVWVLDLPSDLSLPKALITEQAADAIRAFRGPVLEMSASGRWTDADWPREGFPPPDVVVGDCNIPRGSWSLGHITRLHEAGLTDAWSQAGAGLTATYPRTRPLWHLDQVFVGPGLRAAGYGTFSTGTGTHRGVWADVEYRSP
ncbi:MAG: hypothetical protein L6Q35_11350 [Phycisphaerales bacterium]|nr:hypothetical protein [Phycisphaerales bacterium]